MKRVGPIIGCVALAMMTMAIGPVAPVAAPLGAGGPGMIAHSGGCRADSPAGQCCHAGSQPYHCH